MTKWWQKVLFIGIPLILAGIVGLSVSLATGDLVYLELTYALLAVIYLFILNLRWMSVTKKKFKQENNKIYMDPAEEEKRKNVEMLEKERHKINTILFISVVIAAAILGLVLFIIKESV